jgi:hypothetical protein
MWILVLAGGWGTSALARPGSFVDLLVALLLAACVWRAAEAHQRELRERTARTLVTFPASPSTDRPGTSAAGPRTSAILSFTQTDQQPRDSARTTATGEVEE